MIVQGNKVYGTHSDVIKFRVDKAAACVAWDDPESRQRRGIYSYVLCIIVMMMRLKKREKEGESRLALK